MALSPVFLVEMASMKPCKINLGRIFMRKLNFWVPIQEPKWHAPINSSIHLPLSPPEQRSGGQNLSNSYLKQSCFSHGEGFTRNEL